VVGDAEDVEAGRSVEVDHRPERELAVAPGRVGVELAEERARALRAFTASVPAGCDPVGERAVKIGLRAGRSRLDRTVGRVALTRSATRDSIARRAERDGPGRLLRVERSESGIVADRVQFGVAAGE
jgi:hypothetical protein